MHLYYEGKVQYVGETVNVWDGRPFRASRNKPVDKIRWLKASQNDLLRKKGVTNFYRIL